MALLVLLVLGCETEADRRREQLDEVAQEIERRLTAAEVPRVPHGEPWAPAPVRVIVGEGIDVDRAATALELYRAEPDGYAESRRPIPELGPAAVTLTNGRPSAMDERGGELPGLIDALEPPPPPGSMGRAPSQGTMGEHRGPVDLIVGAEVPYATFTQVLLTVVRERYGPRIVVELSGELGQLPVRPLPIMGGCWSRSCITALVGRRSIPVPSAEADPSDSELDLTLAMDERGIDVFGSGGALAAGCRTIRPSGDEGPTLPRRAGAIDRRALASCLQRIDQQFPSEDYVRIQPEAETPFGEVALVASVAVEGNRFPEVRFAAVE